MNLLNNGNDIAIEFVDVSKSYTNLERSALDEVSFQIKKGEFITILGASGSGKTTILKLMNQLIKQDKGDILYFGDNIQNQNIIDLRRHIGYVVQEIGLFSHMTVAENIAIVPELLKWDQVRIDKRVDEMMSLIRLDADQYRDAYPRQLSGGQQQRVGVARALAADPMTILLDEPFGALDAITRGELQQELKNIHMSLSNRTFVLITHDINEAILLGNRVMVVNNGKLEQFAEPYEILHAPQTDYVRSLIETARIQYDLWSDLT